MFSYNALLFLFFRQFAQVPHLVPRRLRSVDDIERKIEKLRRHTMKFKICMGSYVWRFGILMFRLVPQNFWFELTVREKSLWTLLWLTPRLGTVALVLALPYNVQYSYVYSGESSFRPPALAIARKPSPIAPPYACATWAKITKSMYCV